MGNHINRAVTNVNETDGAYNMLGERASIRNNRQIKKSCRVVKFKKTDKNLSYRIYSYKKNIKFKQIKSYKWATAKLTLTEELIRKHHQLYMSERNRNYMKTNGEMRNLKLEHNSLQNYRRELITLIERLSPQIKKSILKGRKKSKVPKA